MRSQMSTVKILDSLNQVSHKGQLEGIVNLHVIILQEVLKLCSGNNQAYCLKMLFTSNPITMLPYNVLTIDLSNI